MKIVAVMGTYRKNGAGAGYVSMLEQAFRALPGVEFETLWLGDYDLQLCRGCRVCYDRGEAACPLKDGYLEAIKVLSAADAAVFYSPTYTLSISGLMKTFFDRSSWVLHRPFFRGRQALVLTAVAAYGAGPALNTLKSIVSMMGFSISGAVGIVGARYESQPRYRARVAGILQKQAEALVRRAGQTVRPRFYDLVAFHFQKSVFGIDGIDCRSDHRYWVESGWARPETEYYCPARISHPCAVLARALAWVLKKSGLLTG